MSRHRMKSRHPRNNVKNTTERPKVEQLEFSRNRLSNGSLEFIAYGSAREVGRSAFILQDRDRTLLLEAGLKLQPDDLSLPPEKLVNHTPELDAIILSHAHVDHSAYIPTMYENDYQGKTFMTEPTLEVAYMLWKDHLKIEGERYWTEDALENAYYHSTTLKYRKKTKIIDDITLEFYNAGHILGSAMSVIDWDGYRILYTGDINDNITPLFNGYHMPEFDEPIDLIISEGTNGCGAVPKRGPTNKQFVHEALNTLNHGNKVLVPTFAVGRSQELLILLTEYIKDYPIFVDGMINKMNAITEKYLTPDWIDPPLMNRLKEEGRSSPFDYDNIFPITSDNYDRPHDFRRHLGSSGEPSVIVSTSGMLMPSPMHTHLKNHGIFKENIVTFVGYQAEGTLGREILEGKRKIELATDFRGKTTTVELKAKVMSFRFSGHSSSEGIQALVSKSKATNSIVVHSDPSNAEDLQSFIGPEQTYIPERMVPINFDMTRVQE